MNVRTANKPHMGVNRYIAGDARCRFEGILDQTIQFVENFQLTDVTLWKRFVEQFRLQPDSEDSGWRGEYWGKMMRGACFVYSYTQNPELYQILTDTVEEIIGCCENNGRISSYKIEKEFTGWDLWCRKYVLLGLQYYLEICQDHRMAERIVECLCSQADSILLRIGPAEEGKIPITSAADLWRGLNSSSILEPFVRLYNITQEEKYLAFAEYIVDTGGTSVGNIFKLALENKFYPYQYPMTKAYEMISCFEGLLEYYRVTKTEWYRQALVNFGNKLLESDFTIIGSSGCTNELFDHSTVRQANTNNEHIMQETCVTVTLMKFFYQMTLLTGDAAYADAFERSLYNAYLGAVNTEKIVGKYISKIHPNAIQEPLPFDSYSPLTAGTRGNGIGGLKLMPDSHYYGCCACIGSAGVGLISKMAVMKAKDGIVLNLYASGTVQVMNPSGHYVHISIDTEYPKDGIVKMQIKTEVTERFVLYVRNPAWSKNTLLKVNGAPVFCDTGYISIDREWRNEDEIELVLDMRTEAIYPIPYGKDILMNKMIGELDYVVPVYDEEDPEAKYHVALRRGPLILAADSRMGYDAGNVFEIEVSESGYVHARMPKEEQALFSHIVELEVPLTDDQTFRVIDYASAGKLWNEESKMAAWIRTGKERKI